MIWWGSYVRRLPRRGLTQTETHSTANALAGAAGAVARERDKSRRIGRNVDGGCDRRGSADRVAGDHTLPVAGLRCGMGRLDARCRRFRAVLARFETGDD